MKTITLNIPQLVILVVISILIGIAVGEDRAREDCVARVVRAR